MHYAHGTITDIIIFVTIIIIIIIRYANINLTGNKSMFHQMRY